MRCAKCGAASWVAETREEPAKFRTRRRRECHNHHRFTTFEVHVQVITAVGPARLAELEAEASNRAARWARDLKVWLAHKAGASYTAVGAKFGLVKGTVQGICERMRKQRSLGDKAKG